MNELEEKSGYRKRSTAMVAGATVSFVFLALLSALNMNVESDSVFGLDNFYQGSKGSPVDPKAQYNAMYNNIMFNADACSLVIQMSDNAKKAASYYWIVEGQTVNTLSELQAIAEDKDTLTKIKPFSNDGQKIIAPGDIEFENANVRQESSDRIDIEIKIGSKYVMEFRDVKSWWCHIGKKDQTKHSDRVGLGGVVPVCAGGYIIGEAKADTTVYLYKIDSNGDFQPASFADLFLVQNGT